MNLSKEKQKEIIEAENRFLAEEDDRYDNMIVELAMSLKLKEETVRKVLDME